jgi:DNA adenine methylase
MGGKFRISKDIAAILNPITKGRPFVDLFCGACNIVDKITTASMRIANDNNPYLIALLKAVQNGWEPPTHATEDDYRYVSAHPDENPALTGFILIGCSFGGAWKSGFAKCSRGRSYALSAHNSLMKQRDKLGGVQFTCSDYSELLIPKGAVVYCDPPYKGTYNHYYKSTFDYDKFLYWVEANKENYDIYISEYARNNINGYQSVWERDSRTGIKGKDSCIIPTREVLLFAS